MDERERLRLDHWRRRWLPPDWEKRVRPDLARILKPDDERKHDVPPEPDADFVELSEAEQEELRHLRWMVKDLKVELMLRRLRRKYSPNQPRVPAGNRDGGQWTSGGGGAERPARHLRRDARSSAARRTICAGR